MCVCVCVCVCVYICVLLGTVTILKLAQLRRGLLGNFGYGAVLPAWIGPLVGFERKARCPCFARVHVVQALQFRRKIGAEDFNKDGFDEQISKFYKFGEIRRLFGAVEIAFFISERCYHT